MGEFCELDDKFSKIENAYNKLRVLNEKLINTPLEEDLKTLVNRFREIQITSSTQKQLLEIDKKEFAQGDIGLEQFSKRVAIRTTEVSNIVFDLDMEISPRLLKLSTMITEPVIEAAEAVQQENSSVKVEAENLRKEMNEVSKEPDVVERIDKTLTLFERVTSLGEKIYPMVKDYGPRLLSLVSWFA